MEVLVLDVSAVLGGGVYVLLREGRPVFVGKAKVLVILRLYAHRTATKAKVPSWMPVKGFVFDQVLVRNCQPQELEKVYQEVLQEYPVELEKVA